LLQSVVESCSEELSSSYPLHLRIQIHFPPNICLHQNHINMWVCPKLQVVSLLVFP
jgi:hypothetical protein